VIHRLLLASEILVAIASVTALPAEAQTVIEEWYSAHVPTPPSIAPVTIDTKKTALLLMDFNRDVCNLGHRVRCAAALPKLAKLIAEARAHGVPVVHVIQQRASSADIPDKIAPLPRRAGISPRDQEMAQQVRVGRAPQVSQRQGRRYSDLDRHFG
jgi:Isochorismatase family